MNLNEAIEYRDKKVKEGYRSDGCTAAPDLGITEWCVMHDVLRSFNPVSSLEADNLFFKGICTKGKRYYPVAAIYWVSVRTQSYIGFEGIAILGIATVVGILAWLQ